MSFTTLPNNLYGFTSPLTPSAFAPIISLRIPKTTDYAPLGAIWVFTTLNKAFLLTSIVSNVASWVQIDISGAAAFTTLTSTGSTTLATAGVTVNTLGSVTGATSTTILAGTAGITLTAPFVSLPGPVFLYSGAGAPANGLALHIGDFYINSTAASAVTRLYVATAVGAWTNVTCAA